MRKPTGKLAFAYQTITELEARVKELEAENAELRKDAERYRWLRDHSSGLGICVADIHYWSDEYIGQAYVELPDGENLDADIDEAIRDWERPND